MVRTHSRQCSVMVWDSHCVLRLDRRGECDARPRRKAFARYMAKRCCSGVVAVDRYPEWRKRTEDCSTEWIIGGLSWASLMGRLSSPRKPIRIRRNEGTGSCSPEAPCALESPFHAYSSLCEGTNNKTRSGYRRWRCIPTQACSR